LLERWD